MKTKAVNRKLLSHDAVEGFAPKQSDIAEHLDLTDRSVREFISMSGIDQNTSTLSDFRIAYIRHLREIAAGRATSGGINLATERAALARAQRERIEMKMAVERSELAPVTLIEEVLTKAASKIAGILEAVPGLVRRRSPKLTANDIEVISLQIAEARNVIAKLSLANLQETETSEVEDAVEELQD